MAIRYSFDFGRPVVQWGLRVKTSEEVMSDIVTCLLANRIVIKNDMSYLNARQIAMQVEEMTHPRTPLHKEAKAFAYWLAGTGPWPSPHEMRAGLVKIRWRVHGKLAKRRGK